MRVLVATTAGAGHFGPLVPFAAALRDAGHDVVVTAPVSFGPVVARAGFEHRPFADAPEEELRAVFDRLPGLSHDEATAAVIGEVFGRIGTRHALPAVEALVAAWRPDLVVRETCELASYIAAERAGVPHARVAVGLASVEAVVRRLVEAPLIELGAERGGAGLDAAPRFTLVPPSMEDPAVPGPAGTLRYRDPPGAGDGQPLPDWWGGSADPLVYVSFGTVAASLGLFPDLYRGVVAALAPLPVRVLLTVGDAGDPAQLEPLPAHVHVERWWRQQDVMPHAAAMVGHGGFGTTLLGLSAGVPMVVVPLFADQPDNARRVAGMGAGIALAGGPAATAELAPAVERVLADGAYRAGARRTAAEIAALPPVADSVARLEALAGAGART